MEILVKMAETEYEDYKEYLKWIKRDLDREVMKRISLEDMAKEQGYALEQETDYVYDVARDAYFKKKIYEKENFGVYGRIIFEEKKRKV